MATVDDSSPMSTGSIFELSVPQLDAFEKNADLGDKDAAFRVAQYYRFTNFNQAQEIHWLLRAATLGHIVAQYNLARRLLMQQKPNLSEALRWAECALVNGNQDAASLIDEINFAAKAK